MLPTTSFFRASRFSRKTHPRKPFFALRDKICRRKLIFALRDFLWKIGASFTLFVFHEKSVPARLISALRDWSLKIASYEALFAVRNSKPIRRAPLGARRWVTPRAERAVRKIAARSVSDEQDRALCNQRAPLSARSRSDNSRALSVHCWVFSDALYLLRGRMIASGCGKFSARHWPKIYLFAKTPWDSLWAKFSTRSAFLSLKIFLISF